MHTRTVQRLYADLIFPIPTLRAGLHPHEPRHEDDLPVVSFGLAILNLGPAVNPKSDTERDANIPYESFFDTEF